MSSAQGRFTGADPKLFPHDITDPQSWNKYSYTRNNPLRYVDPNGEDWLESAMLAWEGAKQYVRDYIQPYTDALANSFQSGPPDSSAGPLPSRQELVRAHADTMAKGIGIVSDAALLLDPTGLGTATRSALKGDNGGALLGMAVLGAPGERIALSEAKQLVGGWAQGTFEKVGASIAYHFEKHGAEVGAGSVWQYLRKAEGFAKNLKGATRTVLDDGAIRYTKNKKYIILDEEKNILSYGSVE